MQSADMGEMILCNARQAQVGESGVDPRNLGGIRPLQPCPARATTRGSFPRDAVFFLFRLFPAKLCTVLRFIAGLSFLCLDAQARVAAFTLLTYNVAGNGTTDWSTNAPLVRAIRRRMV